MPIIERASYDEAEGIAWLRWSFEAPAELVWEGLTDEVWLRRWLGAASGEFRPGGVVRVDHGGMIQTSRVLSCTPGAQLSVTWEFTGEPASEIEVRLQPVDAGTELTLTHTGIPGLARDYAIGWHTHLLYLAGALRASPLALDRFWDVHERVSRAYA